MKLYCAMVEVCEMSGVGRRVATLWSARRLGAISMRRIRGPRMYSQNEEEQCIHDYFAYTARGHFLDIGAYHPFQLSNTRALYERGWRGVFVEPSPTCFRRFAESYGHDPEVALMQVCIGAEVGTADFFDSNGDAVSTLFEGETRRWSSCSTHFSKIQMPVIDVATLIERSPYKQFDFISVDTEGNCLDIIRQLDLNAVGCKMICVEWNGVDLDLFHRRLSDAGMLKIMQNAENLIYARPRKTLRGSHLSFFPVDTTSKLVSILVPVYNTAQYLPDALESLLAQTHGNIEILLQDDGSVDTSMEVCRWYARQEPRIRALEPFEQHRGVVPARNSLLQAATGDFICWNDSDDVSAPDRVEKQVAFLQAHPSIGAVGTGIRHADASMNVLGEQYFPKDPERQRIDPDICCATVMATRAAVQAAGLFQPAFEAGGEDGDWILRLADHHSISNIRDPLYTYRHHKRSLTNNRARTALVRRLGVMARASARARRAGGHDFVRDLDPRHLTEQLGVAGILSHPSLTTDERMLALSLPSEGEEPVLSIAAVTSTGAYLARLIGALDAQSFQSLELLVAAPQAEVEAVARAVSRIDHRITIRIVGHGAGDDPWPALLRGARGVLVLIGGRRSRPSAWKCWEAVKLCLEGPDMDAWVYRRPTTGSAERPRALMRTLEQTRKAAPDIVVRRSRALLALIAADGLLRTMDIDDRLFDLRPLRERATDLARRITEQAGRRIVRMAARARRLVRLRHRVVTMLSTVRIRLRHRVVMMLSTVRTRLRHRRYHIRIRQRMIAVVARLLTHPTARRLNAMPVMRKPKQLGRRLLGLPSVSRAELAGVVVRLRSSSQSPPLITVAVYESWTDFDDAIRFLTPNGEGCWGGVMFRPAAEVSDPDYVLILNLPQEERVQIVAPPERVWLAIGEPPSAMHRLFHVGQGKGTIVLTSDPEVAALRDAERTYILTPVMTRTWHVKRSLDELALMQPFSKSRKLSWVTSDIRLLDGHHRRLKFLDELRKRVALDLYGRGFNPIADKWDGVAPYRYSIAFENTSSPWYFTEKLMDCFVCQTLPLYFGSADAEKFFPAASFVRIDPDDPKVFARIKDVIESDLWLERRDAILEARRLVLYKYNIFSQLSKLMLERHRAASQPMEIAITRNFLEVRP